MYLSVLGILKKQWGRFTKPHGALRDLSKQREARLTSAVILANLILFSTTIPLYNFSLAFIICNVLLLISYLLSRSPYYQTAMILAVIALTIPVFGSLPLGDEWDKLTGFSTLKWLVVPILLSNLIFKPHKMLLTSVLILGGVAGINYLFIPQVTILEWGGMLAFLLTIITIIAVNSVIQYRYLTAPQLEALNKIQSELEARVIARTESLRQSEAQLSEKHAELDRFFTLSLDLLCIATTDGYFIKLNNAWETSLGYAPSELEGRSFLDYIHPDDVRPTSEILIELRAQRPVQIFTNRYLHHDGSYRLLEWRSYPYGKFIYAAANDITERQAAEDALRQSEAQARALLNTIPDLVFQLDAEGYFLDYKSDPSELYSTPDRIIGHNLNEIMPPEFAQMTQMHINNALQTGETQNYYYELETPQLGLQSYEARLAPTATQQIVAIIRNITEQKKTQDALRQSEERFRKAFEESPIGMALISLTGQWLQVNPAVSNMLGYSAAELHEIDFQTITHPDDLAGDLELVRRLIEGEIPSYRLQKRYFHKEGHIIWGLLNVSLVRGEMGEPLHFISQIMDFTENKRLEDSLRVLERAVNYSSAGTVILDAQDYANLPILYVNEAFTRITGYSHEELIGANIRILNQRDRDQPAFNELRAAIQEQRPCNVIARAYRKDGSPFWNEIWLAPVFDEAGTMTHFATTQLDVTERVESQQYLQGILDSSLSGVMAFHPVRNEHGQIIDFEWTLVNAVAEKIVGRSADELLGQRLLVQMPGNRKDGLFEKYINTVETGQITNLEHFYEHEGLRSWFHIVAVKLADGFVVTFSDISERMQARQRAIELITQLEAANQDLKDFAYIVSHDLKAPLRGVSSITNWLMADYGAQIDDAGRELLNLLNGRVKRMDGLINGILEYSRIGRTNEQNIAVNLQDLLGQVSDLVLPPEGFTLHQTCHLPTVWGDPFRLQQVFQNLISNAVMHTDKAQGEIYIACHEQGDQILFSIRDNGPGIEARHFERIFQIFQTLHPRDEQESTGIGLTIVKRIIENYKGKIWVESTLGVGTTFYFTLPRSKKG